MSCCLFHLYICRKHLHQVLIAYQIISGAQLFLLIYLHVKCTWRMHSSLHCCSVCYQAVATLESLLNLAGMSSSVRDLMLSSFHRAGSAIKTVLLITKGLLHFFQLWYQIWYKASLFQDNTLLPGQSVILSSLHQRLKT